MKMPPGVAYNERVAPDILDFMVARDHHRVDAVLVGAYAVGVYGVVLATSDIDFLYRRTAANVQRLCRALEAFGAPPTALDPTSLLTPDMVTMFGLPPIRVIGLAELRANNASTGRAKDKADLGRLPKAL